MTNPVVDAAEAAHPLSASELANLVDQLLRPTTLLEGAVILLCLGLSWLLVRTWRGTQADPKSIWFGYRVFDGVLFPLLALLLAAVVHRALVGLLPLVLFRVALPMLVSLAVIRLMVKVLDTVFPDSSPVRIFERTVSWLVWGASILWILGVLPLFLEALDDITWSFGTTRLSLRHLLEGTLSAVLVLMLSLSLSAAIESRLLKGATQNLSLRKIASNAIRVLLLVVGLLIAMSAVGIDLTALSVFGGAIGVGLGFGLQKLAANYISGFVILAERSLRIGDLVKVNDFEGRITDINTRYTVLRSGNGREAIVPNELLITQRVENASLADPLLQQTTIVQVGYGTDLEALIPRLEQTIRAVPRVLAKPGPAIQFTNFAADGLELTITFWVGDPQNGTGNVRSDVNLAILRLLNAEGIDIPYPQRVLHIADAAAKPE